MEIIQYKQEIPITDEVDIIVLGAGPAGFGAAYSAAKQGKKVMLVEQSGMVGGVATSGLMSHWTGNTKGGLYEELIERAYSFEREINKSIIKEDMIKVRAEKSSLCPQQIINPETLKVVLLRMLEEVGVILRLYTFAMDVHLNEQKDRIQGVLLTSKSGIEMIKATIVIDATGDGDIAYKAGVPFTKGREKDGRMQPVTIMFKMAGVDMSKVKYVYGFEESYEIEAGDLQTIAKQVLKAPAGHVLIYPSTLPDVVTINMTNCIDIDGTDAKDLTKGERVCRYQIQDITHFLRDYVPGFKNAYVMDSASILGVRETRHFKGISMMTEEIILEAKKLEDWLVKDAHFNFDIHNLTGAGLDKDGVQQEFSQSKGYCIPYGCFVVEKINNLLLAGRMISGTHKAHSNYRVMPICVNMGEGVGVAASLAIDVNSSVKDVNIKEIQKILMNTEPNFM
ncbi:FAD-dependent oxidoreductase [Vallitalea maricola]|uniref:FAD-dependent oxidoreductase n=1 Tax=Vallitalea maricola TaxID=3074433 RepID=A0ACB5UHU2_9FIRM|nr:FAD-dependent oxidoreductase [Vallitalea sp. AN17-2]